MVAAWNLLLVLAALDQALGLPEDQQASLRASGNRALSRTVALISGEDRSTFAAYIKGIRQEYAMLHTPTWTTEWETLGLELEKAEIAPEPDQRHLHNGGSRLLGRFFSATLLLFSLGLTHDSHAMAVEGPAVSSIVLDGSKI